MAGLDKPGKPQDLIPAIVLLIFWWYLFLPACRILRSIPDGMNL